MSSPGLRRGLVAAAGLALTVGVAVAVVLLAGSGGAPRRHPRPVVRVQPPPPPPRPKPRPPAPTDTAWPFYGYDLARTRWFPGSQALAPPWRHGWAFQDYSLLEFPPVIYHNTLFVQDYNGSAKALSTITGRIIWQRQLGRLGAASPGLDIRHQLVIFSFLSETPGARVGGNGRVVAVSMRSGRTVWSHALPAGSESSPVVHGLSVFLGDQSGTVYSFRTYDGHLNWTFHASGSVKGGVAFAHDTIYFGDYGARVYAVNARNGREIWSAGAGGSIYSTPAVAYGRVFVGDEGGGVDAYWAASGARAWRDSTGSYVYASPAVADVPGVGPTVFIGSYDGNFYAYNALSGGRRWSHAAGGRIDGSATVLGNLVFYSDLGSKTTAGLDTRSGRQVFFFGDGEFSPLVTDGKAVFLVGKSTIYQLIPEARKRPARVRAGRARRAAGAPARRRTRRRTPGHARRSARRRSG